MEIKFICLDKTVASVFPPLPAKKVIPEWYKNISYYTKNKKANAAEMVVNNDTTPGLSIKACMPFLDYLSSGYVLRYPADIALTALPINEHNAIPWYWRTKCAEGTIGCGYHPQEQLPIEINGINHNYIKIMNPWVVKTPPGYSCFFYQPLDFDSPLQLFSGIVDTDTFDMPINFPGFIKKEGDYTLKGGDPLMVVFPFKRDSWSMKVSVGEIKHLPKVMLFLERGYKNLFHKPKKYE